MSVVKRPEIVGSGHHLVDVLDPAGAVVAVAGDFLAHLAARGCSSNTVLAYGSDLGHLWRFFDAAGLNWDALTPARAVDWLAHLRTTSARRGGQPRAPVLATRDGTSTGLPGLSPATVNRALAAVSSFYDWAILAGRFGGPNPIVRVQDRALVRVTDRHRPFLAGISREPTSRRALQVKTVRRLPRPLDEGQVAALLGALRCRRDLALVRLMLDGGLRPGEALGLHLEDIAYGRRRVTVRHRENHPRGVRQKSRTERVVDLHEAATLEAVAAYVMGERPADAPSPLMFLVGGRGRRRCEPLSYAALARLFARACTRAGMRAPWITPHSLRHTHATRMWELGMRELSLQRRLGHASPESTRIYTRVSDPQVVAEYRRALGLEAATGADPSEDAGR
jgi:integrase/recombinase XerD